MQTAPAAREAGKAADRQAKYIGAKELFRSRFRTLFHSVAHRSSTEMSGWSEITARDVGSSRIIHVEDMAHVISCEDPRPSGEDDVLKLLVLENGVSRFSQDGVEAELRPGKLLLYRPNRPFSFQTSARAHYLILQTPLSILPPRLIDRLARPRVPPDDEYLAPVMLQMLHEAGDQKPTSPHCRHAPQDNDRVTTLVGAVLDLVPCLLLDQTSASLPEETLLAVLLRQAHSFIGAHLADRTLTVETLALAVGCSRRTLFRAFALDQTTPERSIWDRRLDQCMQSLSDRNNQRPPLGDLAVANGFTSAAHFSRSFRNRFGCSPRDARHA